MSDDWYQYGEWADIPILAVDTWNGKYNCAILTNLLGGFLETIIANKDNVEYMFVSRKSMRHMADLAQAMFHKDPQCFHTIVTQYQKERTAHIARMEEIRSMDLSKVPDDELRALFHETREHLGFFGAHDWVSFSFDPLILEAVGLQDYFEEHPEERNEVIALTQPPAILPTLAEEIAVMALAAEAKGMTQAQVLTKYHAQLDALSEAHGWIAGFITYADKSPAQYTKQVVELSEERDLEKELEHKRTFVEHGKERMRQYIKKFKPSTQIISAIEAVQQLSLCRALGDADSIFGFNRSRRIDAEIQRRLGISFQEYWNLRMDEIEALLLGGELPNLSYRNEVEVLKRDSIGDLLPQPQPMQLFWQLLKPGQARQELRGMVACVGHAKGKVRKINSSQDVATFADGEILVAKSTCADYVVVMKKAAAIVTEYGGVTSHAAVVSRELGIPAVIGVAGVMATLQDGDLVEVDAHQGIIRKIEKHQLRGSL